MPTTAPFEAHADRYEQWFDEHAAAYESELTAVDRLLGTPRRGLEVGVGSGRFAGPLGLDYGVDPSARMLACARNRGVEVARSVAEALPYRDGVFDACLVVTTVCFVDDVDEMLAEADRVLDEDGRLVVGFIDRESPVGRRYLAREENPFYREATFVSTDELVEALEAAGFTERSFVQTVFQWPGDTTEPDPVESDHGDGSSVGVGASR